MLPIHQVPWPGRRLDPAVAVPPRQPVHLGRLLCDGRQGDIQSTLKILGKTRAETLANSWANILSRQRSFLSGLYI